MPRLHVADTLLLPLSAWPGWLTVPGYMPADPGLTLAGLPAAQISAAPIAVAVAATAERCGLVPDTSDIRVEHSTTSHTLVRPGAHPARKDAPAAGALAGNVSTAAYGVLVSTQPLPAAADGATPPLGAAAAVVTPDLLAARQVVIVDVETTGWRPQESAIAEIGAVRIGRGEPELEFSALVSPGVPVPAAITELTGITDAMLAHSPPVSAVLPGFLAFASGCILAAHNAPFDLGFLSAACAASALDWPAFAVLDTAELARSVLPAGAVPDHKLATLARFFATSARPAHRALADARATAEVLAGLLAVGYTGGHRNSPGEGRRGAHPGDSPDARPDS